MIVVIAGSRAEYKQWLDNSFCFVGDNSDLVKVDPRDVDRIELVGNFRHNPIYFSDEFLNFQIDIVRAQGDRKVKELEKKSLFDRIFRRKND